MSGIWYPHYIGDYARDTAHLALTEHGAYRLLLDHYYSTGGPLPSDVTALHRICRAFKQSEKDALHSVLAQFFDLRADGYYNQRADREIARQAAIQDRLSQSGRRGAQKRWRQDGMANGSANGPAIAKPQSHSQITPIRAEAEEAASAAANIGPAFRDLGHETPFGDRRFQLAWAEEWNKLVPGRAVDAMELCIQRCEREGVKVPGLFIDHKREIERAEVNQRYKAAVPL